jgi:hypothetical protein
MNLAVIVALSAKHRKSNLTNKSQLLIPWTTLSVTAPCPQIWHCQEEQRWLI